MTGRLAERFARLTEASTRSCRPAQLPLLGEHTVVPGFQFHAVSVYVLHVERRPVVGVAAQRQPENPVINVGIEPCRLAVQRIYSFLPYGKRYPAVVREPRFRHESVFPPGWK